MNHEFRIEYEIFCGTAALTRSLNIYSVLRLLQTNYEIMISNHLGLPKNYYSFEVLSFYEY